MTESTPSEILERPICFFCDKHLDIKSPIQIFKLRLHREKQSNHLNDVIGCFCANCDEVKRQYAQKSYYALLVELNQVLKRSELQRELKFKSQGTLSKYISNQLPKYLSVEVAIQLHKLHLKKLNMIHKRCIVCNQKDSLNIVDLNKYKALSETTDIEHKILVCSKHREAIIFAANLDLQSLLQYLLLSTNIENKSELFSTLGISKATFYRILKEKKGPLPEGNRVYDIALHNRPIPLAVYKLAAHNLYKDKKDFTEAISKLKDWLASEDAKDRLKLKEHYYIKNNRTDKFYECDVAIFDNYGRLKAISLFSESFGSVKTRDKKELLKVMREFGVKDLIILDGNLNICSFESTLKKFVHGTDTAKSELVPQKKANLIKKLIPSEPESKKITLDDKSYLRNKKIQKSPLSNSDAAVNVFFKRGKLILSDDEVVRLCIHFPNIFETLPLSKITPNLIKKVLLTNDVCHKSVPEALKGETFYAVAYAKNLIADITAIPIKMQNDKFYSVLCKVNVEFFKSTPPIHRTKALCKYILNTRPDYIDQMPMEVLMHIDMHAITEEASKIVLEKFLHLFKYVPKKYREGVKGYAKAFAKNHITLSDVPEDIRKIGVSEQRFYDLVFEANQKCFEVIPDRWKTQEMSHQAFMISPEHFFKHIPSHLRSIDMYIEFMEKLPPDEERIYDIYGLFNHHLSELPRHFSEEDKLLIYKRLLRNNQFNFFDLTIEDITPAVRQLVSPYFLEDIWVNKGSIEIILRLPEDHSLIFEEALKATPSAFYSIPEENRTSTMYIISKDYLRFDTLQNLPDIFTDRELEQLYLNGISRFPFFYLTLKAKDKKIAMCEQAFLFNSVTESKFKNMFPSDNWSYDKYERGFVYMRAFSPNLECKDNIALRHYNYNNLKSSFQTEEFSCDVYCSALLYGLESLENIPEKLYIKIFCRLLKVAEDYKEAIRDKYDKQSIWDTPAKSYETIFDESYNSSLDGLFFEFPELWMKANIGLLERVITLRPHLFLRVPKILHTKTMWLYHLDELSKQKSIHGAFDNLPPHFGNESFYHQLLEVNPQLLSQIARIYRTAIVCENALKNHPNHTAVLDIFKNIPNRHKSLELCRYAVELNSQTFKYVPRHLRVNSLNKAAILKSPSLFKYIPKKRRTNELCRLAIKLDANNIRYIPKVYKRKSIFRAALRKSPTSLSLVPLKFRTREACLKAIIAIAPSCLGSASKTFSAFLETPRYYINEGFIKEVLQSAPYLLSNIPKVYLTDAIYEYGVENGIILPMDVPTNVRIKSNYLKRKYLFAIEKLSLVKKVKNNVIEVNRKLNTTLFDNIQKTDFLQLLFNKELVEFINHECTLYFMPEEDKEAFDDASLWNGSEVPRFMKFNDKEKLLISASSFFTTDRKMNIDLLYEWNIDWELDVESWNWDWEESYRESYDQLSEPPWLPSKGDYELYILFEIKLSNLFVEATATAIFSNSIDKDMPEKKHFIGSLAHKIYLSDFL